MGNVRAPGIHELSVVDAESESRDYALFVPNGAVRGLAVIFHPFGSNPELVLHGGIGGGYLSRPITGAAEAAQPLGLAVLTPRARGRSLDGVSLAWKPYLDAVWHLSASLRDEFGLQTIGAGGLSMGGLEALVFAGQHPEGVGAAWATNSIVDLAQWWHDLPHEPGDSGELGVADLIAVEVGDVPDALPDEYRARSPFAYLDGLARVPVRITWSPADGVIPHQRTTHSHLLATHLIERGGEVVEVVLTHLPANESMDAGRFAHEACDVREAMGWLAEVLPSAPTEPTK